MRRYFTSFSKALHEHFQENGSDLSILKSTAEVNLDINLPLIFIMLLLLTLSLLLDHI